MTLGEIAQKLDLEELTPELQDARSATVTGGHVTDLLSDALAHAPAGGVWVTVQTHMNVLAVAVHADLAAIISTSNRRPDEPVRQKAIEEGIAIFVSRGTSFEVVGRLYELGIRSKPGGC